MNWQPAPGTQPLAPFDHQVAGQSSMLRYDTTTVCKPLIAREHFVYKTLPEELKEFTAEYRGEIEVKLVEKDGYIQLYGISLDNDTRDEVCSCSTDPGRTDQEAAVVKPQIAPEQQEEQSVQNNRCIIRVLRSGSYEVFPTTDEVFYAKDSKPHHPHTHNLNPWSLKNHKRLLDKMRKSEHSHNKIRFIMLKNVVADFRHPCILDLKIGSRLHGDDASRVKVASQSQKCVQTTSSSLGVRLCGMQVYQVDTGAYHSVDKYHGRTLNEDSFTDMLYDFMHNGVHLRTELIQPIVTRLSELIKCLQGLTTFRFYASSLLIIYDGDVSAAGAYAASGPEHLGATVEPPPIKQVKDIILSTHNLHHTDAVRSENEGNSTALSFCVPAPSETGTSSSQESAAQCHSSPRLPYMNMNEEHSSGEVPNLLNDVPNSTTHSLSHSCQNVPTGTQPHADTISINQSIVTSSNQKAELCKVHENHLHNSKLNHLSEDEATWLSSHMVQSETGHLASVTLDDRDSTLTADSMSTQINHKTEQHRKNYLMSAGTGGKQQDEPKLDASDRNDKIPHIVKPHESLNQLPANNTTSEVSEQLNKRGRDLGFHNASPRPDLKVDLPGDQISSHTPLQNEQLLKVQSKNCSVEGQQNCGREVKVDVKMIDFAHTTHQGFTSDKVRHDGPDTDYIYGLQTLRKLFEDLQKKTLTFA